MSMTSTEKTLWLLPSVARPISYIWVAVSSFIQNVMELHQDIHAAIHWTSPRLPREPYNWSLESRPINACIKYTSSCLCITVFFPCLYYGWKLRYQRHYKFNHNWFIFQTPIFRDQFLWAPYPLVRSSASSSASNALIFGETPEGVRDMAGILRCFGWIGWRIA